MNDHTKVILLRAGVVTATVILIAVSGPLIFQGLLAELGALGVLILGIFGVGIFKAMPLLGMKWENRILKAQINEAAENPIETRMKIAEEARADITREVDLAARLEGLIRTQEGKNREFKKNYQDQDISEFEEVVSEARELLALTNSQIEQSAVTLKEYEHLTEILNAKLNLAIGVQSLATAMNPMSVKTAYDKIFSDAAAQSVDEQLHGSMAKLHQTTNQLRTARLLDGQVTSQPVMQITHQPASIMQAVNQEKVARS